MSTKIGIVVLLAMAAACGGDESKSGNVELGITEFASSEAGNEVRIIGTDAEGNVRAWMVLATNGTGRKLNMEIVGRSFEREQDGFGQMNLPQMGSLAQELDLFLLDPFVAPILADHDVGILKDAPRAWQASTGETPFDNNCNNPFYSFGGGCNGGNGPTSCCEYWEGTDNSWGENVCCGTSNFVWRKCTFAFDQDNPCGPAGPNGCAICGTMSCNPSNCEASGTYGECFTLTCGNSHWP